MSEKVKDPNENRQGYKKTKIGWIPEDWEIHHFGSLTKTSQYGLSMNASEVGKIPILRMGNIEGGKINYKNLSYVNVSDIKRTKYMVRKNDLLFNRTNSLDLVGKLGIVTEPKPAVFASYLIRFQIITTLAFPPFVAYCFNTPISRIKIKKFATPGVCQYNINQAELQKHFVIAIPPIPEQKKIAEILSIWDKAIDQTRNLIDAKKRRKKALIQQLLVGKTRLRGFKRSKRANSRFPGDWECLRAQELFHVRSIKSCMDEPVLSVTQNEGVVPRDTLDRKIESDEANNSSYKFVEPGDFVISLRSFQGGIEYSKFRGVVSPAYHVIRPKKDIDDTFYRYYFKSYDFIGHLAVAVIGIRDGKQVNYNDFSSLYLPYPTVAEQTKIGRILSAADEEIEILEAKLKAIEKQKRGLMQKLLTGEVRVKV